LWLASSEETVQPGAVAFVPAGETRGIKAATRLVILHVVTPPPTQEDHVQVMAGLRAGRWQ
jgi:quercetin dioxygenase-like cupin family protein